MKLIRGGALFTGLLLVAGAAQAGVTSTWTLTNDYDFRGNSQTAKDPALQGSLDYAHESGWYVGAWGSNIDFQVDEAATGLNDPKLEVDLYTGFTKSLENGFTYDVGGVYYGYPDEGDFDYLEIYGSIAKDWFKTKLWYSPDFGGDTTNGDTEAWYLEANGTWALPANFSILAHVGYSTGDYWDDIYTDDLIDYSIGVGYTAGKFNLALKYVDTDSDVQITSDAFNNEGRVIVTVATTFPWGE
jgi:uncharacterized protein (TIGR02001 family)